MKEPKHNIGDLISRQAVLKIIDGWYEQNRDTENIEDLIVLITYMDSVRSQEPKTGHWEWVQYDSNPNIGNWHCSECRMIIPHMPEETDNTPIYKWCPNCGADMRERSNDEVSD